MRRTHAPELTQSACRTPRPPWRILLPLAGAVMLVHALVLGRSLQHISAAPASAMAPVMITRSIALTPPTPAPALAAPTPTAPQPASRRKPATAPPAATPPAQDPQEAEPDTLPDTAVTDISIDLPQTGSETAPSPSAQAKPEAPAASGSQAKAATPASAPATVSAPPAAPVQTTPVTAMALPSSAQMRYQSTASYKGLTYHANSELLWRHSGASYEVQMSVSALFRSRSMTSQGQVSAQGLAPSRFADKSRSEVAAHFEPDKGQVSFSANTPTVPWVQGGQDRASIFIQLGGMLAGNPAAFPAGSTISLYTVGPRDADTWTFRIEGEEVLSLPFGQLATLKLSRQLRHEHDQKLEVWYAPSLGYLPVRNKLSESNGDFVDQQLSDVDRP